MNIDWSMVTALAALIAALIAILGLRWQARLTRFSNSLDVLWRAENLFRSNKAMLEKRRKAAQALLKGEVTTELDDILDFFELIGLLVRKRALDEEMAWYSFYNLAIGYWLSAQEYILKVRSKDETIWMDFEYLFKRLIDIEKCKRHRPYNQVLPSKELLNKFLNEEAAVS